MKTLFIIALSAGMLAQAQDCVPGNATTSMIADSTHVIIRGIGKNDLHYANKNELLGDTLIVKDGLTLNRDKICEYSGTLRDVQQKLVFFSHVQVELLKQQVQTLSTGCRKDAIGNANLEEGSEVTLLAIHSSDIYSLIDPGLVGKKMKVKTSLKNFSDCWYEGTLEDEFNNIYVFTKIQVKSETGVFSHPIPLKTESKVTIENGRYEQDNIPKAFPVKILEIASSDIMYEKKGLLLGKTAKSTEELKHVGDGWYMGNIQTVDGGQYYFFKVRLGPVGR
ncbi:MAG: hypothetical protein IT233_08065 [Bacteroidia bacterium]|nr:hypothetical protein [Bacteroidia bacterium]